MTSCKICADQFDSLRSLHAHFKKHGISPAEYYCKYYPRYSLHYRIPLPYKNYDEYFSKWFYDAKEVAEWERDGDQNVVKDKSLELLRSRIAEKKYSFSPCSVELKTCCLPSVSCYKKHYGSYSAACRALNVEALFDTACPPEFCTKSLVGLPIIIDTREQDPIPYANSSIEKLFVGDYLLDGENYTYTFVDRKSEGDFLGTMSSGIDRFEREVQKSADIGGYLFVVIESSINKTIENTQKFRKKVKLSYVFHNMRELLHKYPRKIQFVFSGSRENSRHLIPQLLYYGEKLHRCDVQYFLDSRGK